MHDLEMQERSQGWLRGRKHPLDSGVVFVKCQVRGFSTLALEWSS